MTMHQAVVKTKKHVDIQLFHEFYGLKFYTKQVQNLKAVFMSHFV